MPFGRLQKPNNRSQHNIPVESAGPAAGPQSTAGPGSQSIGAIGISSSGPAGAHSQAQPPPPPGSGPGPGHPLTPFQGPSSSSAAPSSALGQGPANLPLTTNESFVQDLRVVSQNQQHPPPHLYASASSPSSIDLDLSAQGLNSQQQQQQHHHHHHQHQHLHAQLHQLQPLNTSTSAEAKVRRAASDFVDAVARSQSHRYNQVSTPIQINPSYGTSYTDLSKTLQADPQSQHPFAYQQQQQQQQQHQQPPQQVAPEQHHQVAAPVEPRRSTRRLIRTILTGAPKSEQNRSDPSHNSYYDNTSGPGRRSSKRLSNPNPPVLRTGPSQVSLEQQPLDWQSQGPPSQPSPSQSIAHEFQQPTLRRVPTNQDQSPFSEADEAAFQQQQQAQIHVQTQLTPDHQQHLGQVAFDPATRQYQFIAHSPHHSPQAPQQSEGNPLAYPGHLGTEHIQNIETISQVSHESPVTEGELQPSSSAPSTAVSPGTRYSTQQDFPSRTSSLQPHQGQASQAQQQQQQPPQEDTDNMAPPPGGGPPQARRQQQDTEKSSRGDLQPGAPPGYRHSQQQSNSMNPMPPGPPGGAGQNNFRTSTIQERAPPAQFDGAAEHGRNSPQPTEDSDKAFKELLQKYKNVKRLYFDGKTQIESLNGQVEQLQNAVANQRISQSRTALDDNEYSTRFNRLNGAINNLSFNIRKDWTSLPEWLSKYVSADALKTGKQEMTAVGRAVITRWLVEKIFYGCFHPGLDPELSRSLKKVEQNIRRFSYTMTSQEEFDALTSKVLSWRMTTLEGLQDVLQSADSANYRQEFIRDATASLTSYVFQHLTDPPPAGVDGSASMIVELAVGIAANLPLESRDVAIRYPVPEDLIQPEFMDVEKTGLPPIETRPSDSDGETDSRGDDTGKESGGEKSSSSKERNKTRAALPPKDSNKVRFAGFLAVEVRGRQVLVKAPVWTLG
ncbi:hypothetical protein M406DRAFT_349040 [Cryphonectria parasitica EP155]|uniref:S-adenosylmethionine-dependent methyltransferase-like protein n=1 Tax=Cryphonectria parasitica (strain ATCC 38755 / EP155) TaxID=660469 RepID=A0A9P4YAT1_CRYP1|nr:uncharacterized protein M406DRAFT_349040 [Cryphonectria parasitica EP155]KAF3770092.1 hypothetical protein M406DRAFT_349040 [Cryphonectria parasitica EP155]